MSNHSVKDLRKQLRNVVQDVLPVFLASESGMEIYKKLQHDLFAYEKSRLDDLEKQIKYQLEQIAERQKEVTTLLKSQIESLKKPVEGSTNE